MASKNGNNTLEQDLDEWLRDQSVWYQLRHGFAGKLCAVGRVQRLFLVGFRLVAGLVVLLLAVAFLNDRYLKSEHYAATVNSRLATALNLPQETRAFRALNSSKNSLMIGKVVLRGGPSSFFDTLQATGIQGRRPMLAGVLRSWFPVDIRMSRLDIGLKTAYTNEDAFLQSCRSVWEDVWLQHIQIDKLFLTWGAGSHAGRIEGARCTCTRKDGVWSLKLQGGTMSYGALEHCRIVDAVVEISQEEGVVLQRLTLRLANPDAGTISIAGRFSGDTRPAFDGRISIDRLILTDYCTPSVSWVLAGAFRCNGTIRGMLDAPHGLNMELSCEQTGDGRVQVHDTLPLLNLLSTYRPEYRTISGQETRIDLARNGETGQWKARHFVFAGTGPDGFRIEGKDIFSRPMTDEEWRMQPFSIRQSEMVAKKHQEQENAVFAVAMGNADHAEASNLNWAIVTRETPVIEGAVQLSFPDSVFPEGFLRNLPDILTQDVAAHRLQLNIRLRDIMRNVSKNEADILKAALLKNQSTHE